MCDKFAHLHVHSDASIIDGLGPVKNLVTQAKRLGFDSLALTDHGTLANAISFSLACEAANIKPILGVEGYVAFDGHIGHITLLADGAKGWRSLVALQNAAHRSKFRRPAFTIDELIDNADGLVCLSGCPASPFHHLPYSEAKQLAMRFKAAFGPRFFIETMVVGDADVWTRPLELSRDTGIKGLVTNDVHFTQETFAPVHKVLTQLKAAFDYNSHALWLKTRKELEHRASEIGIDLSEELTRSWKVSQLIEPVSLKREPVLPGIEDAATALRILTFSGLSRLSGRGDFPDYLARTEHELDIVHRLGYDTYFLILHNVVEYARANGTRVGPGRGSGAGSLILYLIGVTEIDPIEYNLSFERFLNPDRKGYPDVDVDFDSETRPGILSYAQEKWGAVPVATYSRWSHKTLVHDLAKYFKVPRALETEAAERGEESRAFAQFKARDPMIGLAYDAMSGQIRHRGKHAGGIIITDDIAPVERAGDDLVVAWTEGQEKELSHAGIVKFDFLGLSALAALRRMVAEVGEEPPMPQDGDEVFKLFREGDTSGIFQFTGSEGITRLTKEIAPEAFDDIVAATALYRPGALDAGTADLYPQFKKAPRKLHPLIDPILEDTYGVIVYQEQVMSIYAAVTGGSLAEADLARRVIVKSKVGDHEWELQLMKLHEEFVEAATKDDKFEKRQAEQLWQELITHSRYSFNRAHAVAYTVISWQMAWFKYHHPLAFFVAMLNVDSSETMRYLFDAAAHNIEVVPPHVNVSGAEYTHRGGKIYMPLAEVKFLGETGAREIVTERDKRPFSSLQDFMDRITKRGVNGRARKGLWALGAFEGIDGEEKDLAIKDVEIFDEKKNQREYLGIVLPKPEAVRLFKTGGQTVVGAVVDIEEKKSRWGPYKVYRMIPPQSFWSRDYEFEIGDVVKVKIKRESGKALKAKVVG